MQTRPVIQVSELKIEGSEELKFYFKTKAEAENYIAALFPERVLFTITQKIVTACNDEWMVLEKTADYTGCYPKTFDWARNNLAELSNSDLIETIKSNTESVFPVRLIDMPDESQQRGWLSMFGSLWQPAQGDLRANKELVLGSWESEKDRQLMLYVSKDDKNDYLILTTVKPCSNTFKLSAYTLNEEIAASIKMVDAEMKKLLSRKEIELAQLSAKFDADLAHLAENRRRLLAKDHELFAETHQQEASAGTRRRMLK